MGIKCGIVGLPNVGKSTLFNALTAAEIPAENYPFCTIDPNVGIVSVPDPKLEAIATIVKPEKVVPTVVEFVDIAGLVKGASQGEGLGNQFLAHIRETHAILHLVRCFADENVTHVAGQIDPAGDIDVIETELLLADLETVTKAHERAERQAKTNEKEAIAWRDLLARVKTGLEAGTPVRHVELSREDRAELKQLHLITAKPVMYVANVAEAGDADNAHVAAVRERAERDGAATIAICASLEAELAQLEPTEQQEFLADLGLEEPGLKRMIAAAYGLLGLQTFYTAGPKEVRAWTVRKGATAYEAAGEIHTDFQRGFICAETIAYDDYVALGGEHAAKEAGKMRVEGKGYEVKDGDVLHFLFNA